MSDVVVVDYDPAWPLIAHQMAAELRVALAQTLVCLEHIGSTSVPGLAAKPVIDLMAATPDLSWLRQNEGNALLPLGYIRNETGMSGRLFYRRSPGAARQFPVAVHLHVVPTATWAMQNERLFRDHLLAHPEDAERYGELKKELAGRIADPLAYTRAKTTLIQEIVDRARNARGLPVENVWPD